MQPPWCWARALPLGYRNRYVALSEMWYKISVILYDFEINKFWDKLMPWLPASVELVTGHVVITIRIAAPPLASRASRTSPLTTRNMAVPRDDRLYLPALFLSYWEYNNLNNIINEINLPNCRVYFVRFYNYQVNCQRDSALISDFMKRGSNRLG
jgi:hypothetical protein